jgi:hypothetical protein
MAIAPEADRAITLSLDNRQRPRTDLLAHASSVHQQAARKPIVSNPAIFLMMAPRRPAARLK